MPAKKKHSSARARANKAATAATLTDHAPEDRSGWTLAQLRDEVKARNADGRPQDERLSTKGTKADLAAALLEDDFAIPSLPDRPYGWHEITMQWWRDVWTSPMSKEWHPESDYHNVTLAAMHYDDAWKAPTPLERQKATTLFIRMCEPLGLNPYSRRRLEWTIETVAEVKDRGARRRGQTQGTPAPAPAQGGVVDPRAQLHAVK